MIKYDQRTLTLISELLKNNRKFLNIAINDSLRGIRTDVTGDKIGVRTELNVKKKHVSETLKVKLSSLSELAGKISVRLISIPAYDKTKGWGGGYSKPGMNFAGKRLSRPRAISKRTGKRMKGKAFKYSFQFKHGHARETFFNAFPAKMKSGHIGIFIRRKNRKIKEIISSDVYHVVQNKNIYDPVLSAAEKRFVENLIKQYKRIENG